MRLGQADQGRVVRLGWDIRRRCASTKIQWALQPVSGGAVRAQAPPKLAFVQKGCRRVSGCGYVTLRVKAVARGRSAIVALRGACGELARCPPSKRKFSLTILVQ